MNRFLNIIAISVVSALLFHVISRSFSYVAANWILDSAEWPDQRSFLWTLKMGYWLSIGYCVPTFFAALLLLRQKYQVLSTQVVLTAFAITSIVLGLFAGWTIAVDFDLDIDRWSFVFLMLSPLWLFLIHVFILKVVRRAYS